MPRISVIMPVYDQAAFVPRAVASLRRQTGVDWELIVVDDGSTDDVAAALPADPRIRCVRLPHNRGLGAALNTGLELAAGSLIAYLPADDVYHAGHLAALAAVSTADVALAYSGVDHHGDQQSLAEPPGHTLQLVQVMHPATRERWRERSAWESDDLELLFFGRLAGRRAGTEKVTCTWTDHPGQRHKAISERHDGGLNVFRRRYRVAEPLRLRSRAGARVDEVALYARFRDREYPAHGPTVLLVGELAYNPERVLALAERGARLHGLWTGDGLGYNTVGPLPFGHVTDLDHTDWPGAVRALDPDVVYAQLDWRAVPFAAAVRERFPTVPFVWHFKEAPQRSIARGEWPQLARLCTTADAVLFGSAEERDWFYLALPGCDGGVLDASLPKADWLDAPRSPRLGDADGDVHTVVLGRPLGIDPPFVGVLAARGVHLHCHGLRDGPGAGGAWQRWLAAVRDAAPGHVHLHEPVSQPEWVPVLSRYDAAWMHRFSSGNGGDLQRATWDDLNIPARLGTQLAAGLPLLQQHSPGSVVAMQRLVTDERLGYCYSGAEDAAAALLDHRRREALRDDIWQRRRQFTFDHHADALLALLRDVAGRR
ncbi:glycosyltransferase [Mycobacterium sp. MYCO198283]|uniref:glycosyltransferase family 2 protein n=1 Tax=Mycobacterium sp. MYCO198283 TaxID=2883505 RepID=UPI001E52389D|nr:glycosyltransferase [Mycobacterium sp. MYCO198283]MCG5434125.1 glycosyltransferase [Mycobacterium sp. MYCO198283]